MKRLTKKSLGVFYALKHHKPTGEDFCTYDAFFDYSIAVKKLGEYEDAEEQGLLIKLPCKVGDTVWWVPNLNDRTFILSDIASGFSVEYDGIRVVLNKLDIAPYLYNSHLFFSREEAESEFVKDTNLSSKGKNNG